MSILYYQSLYYISAQIINAHQLLHLVLLVLRLAVVLVRTVSQFLNLIHLFYLSGLALKAPLGQLTHRFYLLLAASLRQLGRLLALPRVLDDCALTSLPSEKL